MSGALLVVVMRDNAEQTDRTRSDLALTRAAAGGDQQARSQLMLRLLGRTRITVRCLAGHDADADDIVQLCLIRVLRSAGNFRGEGSLEGWADRIVVRRALRLIKQVRPRRQREVASGELDADVPSPEDVEDRLGRRQQWRRLVRHLQRLTPRRRAVVLLSLVYDHPLAEVAEITGVPLNTVRDRLRLARKQLRRQIAHDPELQDLIPEDRR